MYEIQRTFHMSSICALQANEHWGRIIVLKFDTRWRPSVTTTSTGGAQELTHWRHLVVDQLTSRFDLIITTTHHQIFSKFVKKSLFGGYNNFGTKRYSNEKMPKTTLKVKWCLGAVPQAYELMIHGLKKNILRLLSTLRISMTNLCYWLN